MDISAFNELPVLGIMRGIKPAAVEPLVGVLTTAGLRAIEITMNTPAATALIADAVRASRGKGIAVGAGTVLDRASLAGALDAGASFIVTPVIVEDVIAECVRRKVPVFPGALTPLEIYRSWELGATMVKVFPAGSFGPRYFREITGPFADIKLLACGGVTGANIKEYVAAGAAAVAFGASVFRKDWLERGDYESVGKAAADFVAAYREAR